jgi:hypothetical protein
MDWNRFRIRKITYHRCCPGTERIFRDGPAEVRAFVRMEKNKQALTLNILHALHFDLKERRIKLKQQRTKGEASIERHAVYSNVSGKPNRYD